MANSLPTPTEPPASPRLRRTGAVAVRLAGDLLVLDAIYETWRGGSPLHVWVAAGALVYFGLTAYVLANGGRVGGRGWLMDPVAPFVLFLAFLIASSWSPEGTVHGVRAAGRPTEVVLSAVMVVLVTASAVRMVAPGGARSWWLRGAWLAVCGYGAAAFGHAAMSHTAFVPLLTGHGWPPLPWWIQGTWIGAFVVLPVAFARELGAAIARLSVFPYIRWMFVFGCACWVVFNVASF